MKDTIAITNRKLVPGDYLTQIRKVAGMHPHALILREKDLTAEEYEKLAGEVIRICEQEKVDCYLHSHIQIAEKLSCKNIHIPISKISELGKHKKQFRNISVSCHSEEDVEKAISNGATQIVLGTIFETSCKAGVKGKGLEFVRQISTLCKERGNIPVYAIGGINPDNISQVKQAGAKGGCMMSYMMKLGQGGTQKRPLSHNDLHSTMNVYSFGEFFR